jgi:hypothetical protein
MNELYNLGLALGANHGHTLTLENLQSIERAMLAIAPIDQSNVFKNYLEEVQTRIKWAREEL